MRLRLVVAAFALLAVALVPRVGSAACDDFGLSRAHVAYLLACGMAGGEGGLAEYVPPSTPSYTDVPAASWSFKPVEYVKSKSVISGYPDGGFHPETVVTRDQMAVYVARSMANPTGDAGLVSYTPPTTPSFSDVPASYWAYKYIEYIKEHGVVEGDGQGNFHPGDPMLATEGILWVNRAFSWSSGLDACALRVTDFSAAPVSGLAPLPVTFTDLSRGNPTSWSWQFGDGGISTAQSPSHSYQAGGAYSVTLTTTNAAGTDSCEKGNFVSVTAIAPVAGFSAAPVSGRSPLTVSFTDTSSDAPTGWTWDFGDGGTSEAQNPVHQYLHAGVYSVDLTVTNGAGTSSSSKPNLITVDGGVGAFDPNDDFDDGVIDTSKWLAHADQGATLTETGGKLVLTQSPTDLGHDVGATISSLYRLRGAFDIQVDYELTQWPAENQVAIAICASPRPTDENALQRISWPVSGELYGAAFNAWTVGVPVSISTSDMAGKLRLVRDASNVLSGYYWKADTSEWVLVHLEQVPAEDFVVILYCWGDVHAPISVAFDNFRVNSGYLVPGVPTVTDVQIDRGRDADWWDWSYWHTRYVVQVQGSAEEQPAQLWLQDMQGCRQVIQTDGNHWYDPAGTNPGGSWEDARVIAGPNDTYTYVWYEARQALPIPAGSYTLTVVGSAGSQTSLTTASFPAVPDAVPTLTGPADQSASASAVPTFQWLPLSGTKATLQVRGEGNTTYTGPAPEQDDCGQIWRVPVTGLNSAQYNSDGTGPALDPGRTYFWQISDWTPVDDRVSDPRVSVWDSQTSRHRFTVDTVWPALPALPGRLAYEQTMYGDGSDPYNLQAILQYGTTPAQRRWVGPDGSHTPSYSWDGTKIAYRLSDWGLRVANADGTSSVRLMGNWDWNSADFSPDATWVTYSDGEAQGSSPQHVYIQKLFETTRTLVVRARGNTTRGARWSPDGLWISYDSCCDPSGNNVWLIHPDGTGDHPLLPTGVTGYPGATDLSISGKPVWSPDATRLGVAFSLKTSAGIDVSGLGTISGDGGAITPVWISSPGYVCCAAPGYGTWSPDGQSLVFNSAHHLPVDPDWKNGKLEPGVELWLIKADGSGSPTRLTYDYSYSEAGAWWAPNTPVGSDVAVTKGDATVTFDSVTAEGSTAACVTADFPGPAPEGYALLGGVWKLLSTAAHADGLALALHYADVVVPTGSESMVSLLAWEGGAWTDVTQTLDQDGCLVTGRATNPSYFTLARRLHVFTDVPTGSWAFDAVAACVDAGIVSGYPDGTYQPTHPVSRDQMAVYISRALAGGDANVPPAPAAASFIDVPTDYWAFRYVEYAKSKSIVSGYPDGLYHPTDAVDRGQMAVFIARAMVNPTGDTGLAGYTPPATPSFTDVASGFYAFKYVEYIKSKSVTGGYPDGLYHPEGVVTRDQMAVYVQRAFQLPV